MNNNLAIENNIKKIKKLIENGNALSSHFVQDDFNRWIKTVKHAIEKIFGESSNYSNKISNIRFIPSSYIIGTNLTPYKINGIKSTIDYLSLFLEDLEEELEDTVIINNTSNTTQTTESSPINNKVFIVHGHDELAKTEVARFLEKFEIEAIILHEQASSGNTIIEKIEEHTNVGFGIVLYTPCDIGNTKDKKDELNFRARQNVVFEHGFLIGKIGRENVCALKKEEVETPGDISGIVYTPMDSYGGWKMQLLKELKSSGYNIDMNKLYN